jgi:hypothetical protein
VQTAGSRALSKIFTPEISTPGRASENQMANWDRIPVEHRKMGDDRFPAFMAYAALPRINFFDSRRKGSIPYVPRQRLAPGVPPASRRPAGQGTALVSLGLAGFL